MNDLPTEALSVDVFLAWSARAEGRYELVDGVVYRQTRKSAGHAAAKLAVAIALTNSVRRHRLPCHVLPDGMATRVGARTVFEPDAMVYCGPELPADTLLVEHPLIVVEVISPTTGRNDHTRKLAGYFNLPSVRDYLIVDPDDRLVVHHERRDDGVVVSHILTGGAARLDPPGLELPLAEIYG